MSEGAHAARQEAGARLLDVHSAAIERLKGINPDGDIVTDADVLELMALANQYETDWSFGLPDPEDLVEKNPNAIITTKRFLVPRHGPDRTTDWIEVLLHAKQSDSMVGEVSGRPVVVPVMSIHDISRLTAILLRKATKEVEHVLGLTR